jgi:SEL1 protein
MLGTSWHYTKQIFTFLFMNNPAADNMRGQKPTRVSEPLYQATKLLVDSSNQGNLDAIYTIANLNFYGTYQYPRNFSRAFEFYSDLAAMTGNSTAQNMMAFMYATGIGGAVKKDQARAFLYHTIAAEGDDVRSQMTTAYRHHAGISTPRNCEKAVHYYKKAADKSIEFIRSGPPGGLNPAKQAFRLADEDGGVYGEGASASSTGMNAKPGGTNAENNKQFDDVLEYFDLMSRKGDLKATFGLGRMHYDGSRALKRDFKTAKEYFYDVARRYWTKEGKVKQDTEPGTDKLASKAAGYLGRMFLRGEGMKQDFIKARIWFRRGIENGDALCQYSMGLMYLQGLGLPKDVVKASEYFGTAADQDWAPAQVRLGALLMDQGDLASATKYFELATRNQNTEAYYYLAELSNLGAGRERNCNVAASFYKLVVEKAEDLHSSFGQANDAYDDGDLDTALLLYMQAAEQGYESAQANVAYLLDQPRTLSPLANLLPIFKRKPSDVLGDAALALIYWTRSAKQQNIDSLVKMGDYYLFGLGTSDSLPDEKKAASCYQAAADTLQSAQAMWNLGWMHENGVGIEQDFHLAKRYYDQSGDTNLEAYAPVAVALLKLRVRSWWNWVSGGSVKGIGEEKERKRYTFNEWIMNFLAADMEAYEAELAGGGDDEGLVGMDEWAGVSGDGGYYEEDWADFSDDMLETLIILGLAATLAFLVWYRQQRQMRERREREAQAQAQGQQAGVVPVAAVPVQPAVQAEADRGLFPRPDDPAFMQWAAGGIGH